MNFADYRQHDALGLAGLVRAGQVSAMELLDVALARLEAVDPQLNTVAVRMDAIARDRAARALAGPFAGVPFLLKSIGQPHAGAVSPQGCAALRERGRPAPAHAEITRRWLDSGVVPFGQTATPEFGLLPVTEPLAFGATRNPWQATRSPGGSSGGAAAAVAAGVVPMAGGNDMGGSLRIPAAACGLFGFKPGRGRTPWGPERGEAMHGAAVNHVLTRSVRDSAALLDASHGPETASPFHLQRPAGPYLQAIARPPGRLRIAFSVGSPLGGRVSRQTGPAVVRAAHLLASLGHHVEVAQPPIPWPQMFGDLMVMVCVQAAQQVAAVRAATGAPARAFERDTLLMAGLGRALRADEYAASLGRWLDYQRIVNLFFEQHDVYMTPTLPCAPPRIGEHATPRHEQLAAALLQRVGLSRWLMQSPHLQRRQGRFLNFAAFTALANLTGTPAMSVPLAWRSDGLPIGVHFMAGLSQEARLLQLAAQLETAQPWFGRVPCWPPSPSIPFVENI